MFSHSAHLLPLLALSTSALAGLLPRQDCADTAWTTETPAPVTTTTYVNLDVFYTTSTVTAYALSPPASTHAQATAAPTTTSNAVAYVRRAPQATTLCEAAITSTTTALTPTTTLTSTWTFSRAVQVTTYLQACDASTNFGQTRGTLNINNRYHSFSSREINSSDSTVADCCLTCFKGAGSKAGCMSWGFNDNACSMTIVDAACPRGDAGTEAIMYPNEEKPFVGHGPCLKEVAYFVEG
ncbi:hypothetical protein B9Z65_4411 [Elsinoe australis]|uniref:Apple domain-containing protein n=1 Tax=Elsinoe australis TaxID=40998 RepID=A0A2P7Z2R0_9PEZI|nr:hypothetical protein B9Z65_4411 [Elsinoe australis]